MQNCNKKLIIKRILFSIFVFFPSVVLPDYVLADTEQPVAPLFTSPGTKKFDKKDSRETAQVYVFKNAKEKQLLCGEWRFQYLPGGQGNPEIPFYTTTYEPADWQTIAVPGHWELQGFASPGFKEAAPGIGLYRTTFSFPAERLSGNTFIVFEGVFHSYQVWINGDPVGEWDSPYNRAVFDISAHLKAGPNLLAVKVFARTNGYRFDISENWALAGIYRDVYLYTVPEVYIRNLQVEPVPDNPELASLQIKLELAGEDKSLNWGRVKVDGALYDAQGKLVQKFNSGNRVENSENGEAIELTTTGFSGIKTGWLTGEIKIKNPRLWTAESPYLYNLTLTVKYNNKTLQVGSESLGIRQVGVDNGILQVNGQPVKLRGINWSEFYPDTGKSLTEQQIVNDLKLLKAAHINFIRTTYAPPQPHFLELTDEWGFYVMCDLPVGPSDPQVPGTLNVPVYAGQLGKRVRASVRRDQNRASLLLWGMGNGAGPDPLLTELGRYVKDLDHTRLICYPCRNLNLAEEDALLPSYVDLLTAEFPRLETVKEHLKQEFHRPLLYTAYADALGLGADRMPGLWEQMYRNPMIAGGAIWQFADPGIKRKQVKQADTLPSRQVVLADNSSYYDNHGLTGCDGIVYADRVLQSDYWQCQAVYNPVRAVENKVVIKAGHQELHFTLENRNDFLDLTAFNTHWELYEDRKILQQGELSLSCPPHQSCEVMLPVHIPGDPALNLYWLRLLTCDASGRQVCEQVIRCLPPGGMMQLEKRLFRLLAPGKVSMDRNTNGITTVNIDANGGYRLLYNQEVGTVALQSKAGLPLIKNGPFPRVGRKLNLAEQTAVNGQQMEIWTPPLLQDPFIVLAKEMTQNKSEVRIRTDYWYERPKVSTATMGQSLEGGTRFVADSRGFIEVLYNYKTDNATGILLDAGVSFIIPGNLTEFYWIGRGPCPTYPGQEDLSNFGFFHQNINDLYFQGNRSLVLFAALTDGQGNGIALLGDWGAINLTLERSAEGLVLSYNALMSSRGNRDQEPEVQVNAGKAGWITGEFKILPFNTRVWKDCFRAWLGETDSLAVPFRPYSQSYDQEGLVIK